MTESVEQSGTDSFCEHKAVYQLLEISGLRCDSCGKRFDPAPEQARVIDI